MTGIDQLITDLSSTMEAKPPVATPWATFGKWVGCSVVYIALLLAGFGVRPDITQALQSPFFVVEIVSLAAILLTSLLAAITLAFPDRYQRKNLSGLPLLSLTLFVITLYASWLHDTPPAPQPEHSFACLACIALFSLLPTATMLYRLRGYATTHYCLSGGITLLAAGSLGCFTLRLSEQTDSISHVVLWHYLPITGFCLIGVWLGRRLLKW